MLQIIRKDKLVTVTLCLALALLIAATAVFFARRAARQKREALLRQTEAVWTRAVEGEADCFLKLTLADGRMEYRFISLAYPALSETLFTYSYAAVNGRTLRITYPDGASRDVTAALSEDGRELTLIPAVTVAEASETWTRALPD